MEEMLDTLTLMFPKTNREVLHSLLLTEGNFDRVVSALSQSAPSSLFSLTLSFGLSAHAPP